MAPSGGHTLVPKVMNTIRFAIAKTAQAVRTRLSQPTNGTTATTQPIAIPIRNIGPRHPLHPLAALRQSRSIHTGPSSFSRSFSTNLRALLAQTYPTLQSARTTSRTLTLARAPSMPTFGSALRPRLTGGALPRTAGGYVGLGGKRAFSHVPSAQAHVLANVSAAVRAFWVNGQRARFDGVDGRGEKRFVAIGVQTETVGKMVRDVEGVWDDVRGTSVEFCVVPELNALRRGAEKGSAGGLGEAVMPLATDFARNLAVMAAVHADLRRLATLGDLPVFEPRPGWVAVRFPGCDGKTVESLCDELGVCRGVVREDEAWTEEAAKDVRMALLFPTAPSEGTEEDDDDAAAYFYDRHDGSLVLPESLKDASLLDSEAPFTADETLSPLESLHGSRAKSHTHSFEHLSHPASLASWHPNPWISEANRRFDNGGGGNSREGRARRSAGSAGFQGVSNESMELENIYQFIAECDGRLGRPTSPLR